MKTCFLGVLAMSGLLSSDASAERKALAGSDFRPSLCASAETEVATCHVDRKLASVCGLRPHEAVYRFGTARRLELEARGLRYSTAMYSGGGETQIYFARGGHRYILYDLVNRTNFGPGPNDPSMTSRLVLQTGNRFRILSECPVIGTAIRSSLVKLYMPYGAFIEHDELNR